MQEFPFRWTTPYRIAAMPFGVLPSTAFVRIDGGELGIRFGFWTLRTAVGNVVGCEESSGYSMLKTAGPAHLSFADQGVTFATNPHRGLCMRFAEPVPALDPMGKIRHPGAHGDGGGCRRAAAGARALTLLGDLPRDRLRPFEQCDRFCVPSP